MKLAQYDPNEDEPVLTIEQDGHRKWLVAKQSGCVAKIRLPLQIDKMEEDEAAFHIEKLCKELHNKLTKKRGVLVKTN